MPEPSPFEHARARLGAGASVESLVGEALDAARARADLNAVTHPDAEGALAAARALDAERAAGRDRPLAGLVVGTKANLCVAGRPLTAGSRMLAGFESTFTSTAVERLLAAGAVCIGALGCDEFGMGSAGETSAHGPTLNPLDPDRTPGGSSSGSAAAVAAHIVHAALGSDTGGSVRLPAAFTGTVGLKPTYGRVSRWGLVAFASSFDTVGPLARSVADAARVLGAVAGPDPRDMTSAQLEVPDFLSGLDAGVRGLRVGLPDEYFADGLDPGVRDVLAAEAERLRAAGAETVRMSLPHTAAGVATYYILTTAEASSNLARYDGVRFGHRADEAAVRARHAHERAALDAAVDAAPSGEARERARRARAAHEGLMEALVTESRTEGFGLEVKRRILLGAFVLSAGYVEAYAEQAQRVRTLVRQDFDRAFASCDVLLAPVAPGLPPRLGAVSDPLEAYLGDVHTVGASLAGLPALSVPARTAHPSGLPVGVQIVGQAFDEATVLRVGAAVEAEPVAA